jgi:hypothetical protein
MTNLEQFLNKKENKDIVNIEPISGSFSCQHQDCHEVVNDGYVDRVKNRINWVCIYGHESSVIV